MILIKWLIFLGVIIWVCVGLFLKFKKPKEKTAKEQNKIFTFNYIGNLILCHTATIFFYMVWGYLSSTVYFLGAGMSWLALVLHIHDVTGKSIESIFDKLEFSMANIKSNAFVRITLILILIFIIFAIVAMVLTKIL